jgi:hypothetical protein
VSSLAIPKPSYFTDNLKLSIQMIGKQSYFDGKQMTMIDYISTQLLFGFYNELELAPVIVNDIPNPLEPEIFGFGRH